MARRLPARRLASKLRRELAETKVEGITKAEYLGLRVLKYLSSSAPWAARAYNYAVRDKGNSRFVVSNGVGRFDVGWLDDSLGKCSPELELESQRFLSQRNGVFIDIGANFGFYSILALNRFGYSSAVCVEPNPLVAAVLRHNVALNGLDGKMTVKNLALGNEEGTAEFARFCTLTGRSRLVNSSVGKFDRRSYEIMPVDVMPCDRLLEDIGVDPEDIGFIKIDVEGAEYEVLRGMRRCLEATQATLMVEIWKANEHNEQTAIMLRETGFTLLAKANRNVVYIKD